jgi:hypothetical protein
VHREPVPTRDPPNQDFVARLKCVQRAALVR